MDFDKILADLGHFGRYQKFLYLLVCVCAVFNGIFFVMSAIVLAVPDHRCKIPGYDNDTFSIQNKVHREIVNNYIPPSNDEMYAYDQCHLYTFNWTSVRFDNSSRPINGTKIKCKEWVYSKDDFKETFVTEQNLVCGDSYKKSLAQSCYFFGLFVGAFLFGNASDMFGRKKMFCLCLFLTLISTMAMAWSPNFIFFCVCVVVIGLSAEGAYSTGYVIGLELVGPSKRLYTGIIVNYFFAMGLIVLSGISYFVRHWKYIEIICSAPVALFIIYWWILPESPRWLIAKHKYKEAKEILEKAAHVNKVTISDDILEKLLDGCGENGDKIRNGKLWQLCSSRVMLLRTLIIFCNWWVVSMVYYGLSLSSGDLGGNFFLNFALSGLVEFPAYTLLLLLLDRLGRKWLHCICMILGGSACLSTIFTVLYLDEKYEAVTITLAMLGKLGAAAAFGAIYLYSAELFPTVVRNAGMGASACIANFGSIAAPYISDLGHQVGDKMGKALPLIIFGISSIIAGVLALNLPETLNQELPETIEDGILFGTPAYKARKDSINISSRRQDDEDHIHVNT